jgi:SAM-dependent methyltransferase
MPTTVTFIDKVYKRYVSLNGSAHSPLSEPERQRLVRAYTWYLKPLIDGHARGRWLDVGCGQGTLLRVAQDLGFDVLGVDSSAEMLAVAQHCGLPAENGEALTYLREVPSNSLAVVSAFDILEHLAPETCLELLIEVRRALEADGLLLVKVPNGASPWSNAVFHSDLTHQVLYTPASLTQMMSMAGFGSCECREVPPAAVSLKGCVRACLWPLVRAAYQFLDLIETGSPGFDVKTRVMLARVTNESKR